MTRLTLLFVATIFVLNAGCSIIDEVRDPAKYEECKSEAPQRLIQHFPKSVDADTASMYFTQGALQGGGFFQVKVRFRDREAWSHEAKRYLERDGAIVHERGDTTMHPIILTSTPCECPSASDQVIDLIEDGLSGCGVVLQSKDQTIIYWAEWD